jgi:hypothetical protein
MMRKRCGIALVVALVAIASPSGADVLCKKKSGVLTTRATCKAKETLVNPSSLGLVGPAGPAGAAGAAGAAGEQGPAGPGAQWALVDTDGTILAQSGGITVVDATGTGVTDLNFGSDQSAKNIQVTSSCTPASCSFRGGTSGAHCGGAPLGVTCSDGADTTSHIRVFTRNSADNATEDHPFFVATF